MTSFLGVPIRVGETVFGNLYLTQKRSGCFTVADETVVLALATAAGIAIDKARTHAQARRSEQWQRSMARINQQLLAGDDSSDVLALIASSARSMATAEVALIGFDDGDGAPMPTDKPCILIPFSWQGQNAALCVANPGSEQRFDPDVVSQLQSFAGQAALALELAAARREGERLAVYEDRDRIARDLHDTVVQRLFAAGMQLESISRRLEPNEVSGVQRVVDDLDATIREIRSSIYSLQTVDRATVIGLRARIAGLLDQLRSILGFTPALSIDGPIDAVVGDDAANDVVSVLRELLSNAARHAHASRISVCVSTSGDDIVLVVADDGVGFDVADENARRSGLRNARERAELRGGKFDVRSQEPDEHGWVTRIRWSIPNA
jgi:signal transduction histidine kinase